MKKNNLFLILSLICLFILFVNSIFVITELFDNIFSINTIIITVLFVGFLVGMILQFVSMTKGKNTENRDRIIAILSSILMLGASLTLYCYDYYFLKAPYYLAIIPAIVSLINVVLVLLSNIREFTELEGMILDKDKKLEKNEQIYKIINAVLLVGVLGFTIVAGMSEISGYIYPNQEIGIKIHAIILGINMVYSIAMIVMIILTTFQNMNNMNKVLIVMLTLVTLYPSITYYQNYLHLNILLPIFAIFAMYLTFRIPKIENEK